MCASEHIKTCAHLHNGYFVCADMQRSAPVISSKAWDLSEEVTSQLNFQREEELDGAENTLRCNRHGVKYERITAAASATDGTIKAQTFFCFEDTQTHS